MDSLDEQLAALKMMNSASSVAGQSPGKKVGPAVPPKPKKTLPQVPKSCTVKAAREPSYSMLLQGSGGSGNTEPVPLYSNLSQLQQGPKQLADNAILHRNQMNGSHTYSNVHLHGEPRTDRPMTSLGSDGLVYSNIMHRTPRDISTYSNIQTCNGFGTNGDELPPPPLDLQTVNSSEYVQCNVSGSNCFPPPPPLPDDDLPLPPSPVSSSYSELQRATDTPYQQGYQQQQYQPQEYQQQGFQQTFPQEYGNYDPSFQDNHTDYYAFGPSSQSSSTYESIYEAINPRPPSQMSSRSNYSLYAPYVSGSQSQVQQGTALLPSPAKEAEVDALTSLLVQSLDGSQDSDIYGICVKCGERILGESSGCTAMEQVYHITCFTCCHCAINLQGKPFYALEDKPYCEEDYLNTLEKCSVCMKPILDRILRATGKPYHPACFSCIVCGKSLDGIPFTVDATNQIHCIEDFHRKFAPRCCVCKLPIMPEAGQDETVRVVALDRSFHISCYKCEDCGLLLSSEAEGRGCYPLDDHVLCKSCNAERVQALTTHMTTEL